MDLFADEAENLYPARMQMALSFGLAHRLRLFRDRLSVDHGRHRMARPPSE
jgi:hypothetical protein